MSLLPSECPNCGRLHRGYNFDADPGPVQRERDELKSLCLDMGELLRKPVDEIEEGDAADVLARLSRLGAGDSNPRHGPGRGQNEKEHDDG